MEHNQTYKVCIIVSFIVDIEKVLGEFVIYDGL
jgi:hypothetical protein